MLPIEKFEVWAETAYGCRNNKFTILGSGILCETAKFIGQKIHKFHGSKSERYFVKCFCASTKGNSFLLCYPESAMFP